jgi:hypothetical protein
MSNKQKLHSAIHIVNDWMERNWDEDEEVINSMKEIIDQLKKSFERVEQLEKGIDNVTEINKIVSIYLGNRSEKYEKALRRVSNIAYYSIIPFGSVKKIGKIVDEALKN